MLHVLIFWTPDDIGPTFRPPQCIFAIFNSQLPCTGSLGSFLVPLFLLRAQSSHVDLCPGYVFASRTHVLQIRILLESFASHSHVLQIRIGYCTRAKVLISSQNETLLRGCSQSSWKPKINQGITWQRHCPQMPTTKIRFEQVGYSTTAPQ